MSNYVARRTQAVSRFARDHGINELAADQLVTEWEYEANRRGLNQLDGSFWTTAHEWMAGELATRRGPAKPEPDA
ncbi:MAG TPA: hypothetical protein VM344_07355 [Vitreimonas sp.]|nr:hypothetical protein [Vitreimonas sp.]